MRRPGAGGNQPGVMTGINDFRLLTAVVVDLFVCLCGEKTRESIHHRQESLRCQSSGHGNHILFGNPVLDEALRILGLKVPYAAIRCQVAVQDHNVSTFSGDLDERLRIDLADRSAGEVGSGFNDSVPDCVTHEAGNGFQVEFEHDAGAMRFHRLYADA